MQRVVHLAEHISGSAPLPSLQDIYLKCCKVILCLSVSEHVSGVERERSGERSDHISFRAESVFLKIALRSLNTLSAARSAQNTLW